MCHPLCASGLNIPTRSPSDAIAYASLARFVRAALVLRDCGWMLVLGQSCGLLGATVIVLAFHKVETDERPCSRDAGDERLEQFLFNIPVITQPTSQEEQ